MNLETKQCQSCQQNFTIESEDFEFYAKIKVPAPTWCPECRMVRRMAFKNDRSLYRRKCDLCSKDIISIFNKDVLHPVYCPPCWWSDKWNELDYGVDYDFSKSFFIQLVELSKKVPKLGLYIDYPNIVNSEYVNNAGPMKNCYLIFSSGNDENCQYSCKVENSKDSLDCLRCYTVENSYELYNGEDGYRVFFSTNFYDCIDVYFSKSLKHCSNCFGCSNLSYKNYYRFNKPYTKEDYLNFLDNLDMGSYKTIQEYKEKSENLWSRGINRCNTNGLFNVNVSGDYIASSKNVFNSFEIAKGENLKYCSMLTVPSSSNSYDYTDWGENADLVYESVNIGTQIYNVKFCVSSYVGSYWQYCNLVYTSHNMFGCISMRNKQYCILNKQYTKEEYEQLVSKIIEHMNAMPYIDKKGRIYKYGEFFPSELSPFAYNETIAQEYFPLTKEQAIEQGYNWKDQEERNIQIDLKSEDLPDHIKDVNDDILNKVIQCATFSRHSERSEESKRSFANSQDNWTPEMFGCTTAFKIIKPELEFYRKMNLPLPRLCPNCRHYQRLKQRNPLKLWKRQCQCQGNQGKNPNNPNIYQNTITHQHGTEPCLNTFETTYSPDRPEIVYCEKCYNGEVV